MQQLIVMVVTVAFVFLYPVLQQRLRARKPRTALPRRGAGRWWEREHPPGPGHPLGVDTPERMQLLGWLRCASAVLHDGGGWETYRREAAARDLAEIWGISSAEKFRAFHERIRGTANDGFDYVRYIGVLLSAIRAGYATPDEIWASLAGLATRIQDEYDDFESVWRSYLRGYQRMMGDHAPPEQSTRPDVQARVANTVRWAKHVVPFGALRVAAPAPTLTLEYVGVDGEVRTRTISRGR